MQVSWFRRITFLITQAMLGCILSIVFIQCGGQGYNAAGTVSSGSANTKNVVIPSGAAGLGTAAYGTNPLIISKGTTVQWTNNDSMAHTVTSTTSIFNSGVLNAGSTYSFTFNTTGSFPYFCTIHGQSSMSGTVQVQ